jgi:hypothetical protein
MKKILWNIIYKDILKYKEEAKKYDEEWYRIPGTIISNFESRYVDVEKRYLAGERSNNLIEWIYYDNGYFGRSVKGHILFLLNIFLSLQYNFLIVFFVVFLYLILFFK